MKALGGVLGILQRPPDEFLQGRRSFEAQISSTAGVHATLTAEVILEGFDKSIEQLIRERNEARKRKDFAEADRIRKLLLDNGIVLEDRGPETTWRRA